MSLGAPSWRSYPPDRPCRNSQRLEWLPIVIPLCVLMAWSRKFLRHAQDRRNARNHAPCQRRRRRTGERVSARFLGPVRRVQENEDNVARIGDREYGQEGRHQDMRLVTMSVEDRLLGRAGLAADVVARDVRLAAGAVGHDIAQEL